MQTETSYPKDKIKILLLEGIHQSAIDTFKAADYHNIELLPKALPEEQLIEKIKDIRPKKPIGRIIGVQVRDS